MVVKSKKNFVCPLDKRRFSTNAGLAAHKAANHQGTPNQKPAGKIRQTGNKVAVGGSLNRVVTGTDLLGAFTLGPTDQAFKKLAQLQINPRQFQGTRLCGESRLWGRWRPKKLALRFISSAGSVVGGSYVAGWAVNPNERMIPGVSGPTKIATLRPNFATHVHQPAALSLPTDTTQKWLLCEGTEVEDTTHGIVLVQTGATVNNITDGRVTISIYLDWSVEFSQPDIDLQTGSSSTIYADEGYDYYFTDSSSDWANGDKLTLKHKQGGSVVAFSKAEPGVVYKLDGRATLDYSISSQSTGKIGYGVRIKNFPYPALAVFAETGLAHAKAYAASGDTAHCIDYFGAGNYVKPSNPAWEAIDEVNLDLTCSRPGPPIAPPPLPRSLWQWPTWRWANNSVCYENFLWRTCS